jgi:hypothetical protein
MFKERKTEGERNKMLTENECVRVFRWNVCVWESVCECVEMKCVCVCERECVSVCKRECVFQGNVFEKRAKKKFMYE